MTTTEQATAEKSAEAIGPPPHTHVWGPCITKIWTSVRHCQVTACLATTPCTP